MRPFPRHLLSAILAVSTGAASAGETVQIDVRDILDGRSVTTLSPGADGAAIVTWNAPLGFGATGACGYLTTAAWQHLNTSGRPANALPDDGVFAATGTRPRVVLNYSNADGCGRQTRTVYGTGAFAFAVPPQAYARMLLFFSAAPCLWTDIVVTAVYADGSEVALSTKVPEFSLRVPRPLADQRWSVLANDIGKWDAKNDCREAGKHFIDALDIGPDPAKVLVRIRVDSKPPPLRPELKVPVKEAFLTFWGATGVTAR